MDLFADGSDVDGEHPYDRLAAQIAANLSKELTARLGNQYFCGLSYEFDGEADSVLETGCPDLEVSVQRIVPVDGKVRSTLQALAVTPGKVLAVEAQRELDPAQAQADLEVGRAREAALEQQQLNAELDATAASAFCRRLAEAGVDCALLAAAENGAASTIIVDPNGDSTLLIDPHPNSLLCN